eukprot:756503-Hanusia_phi.AAC.2
MRKPLKGSCSPIVLPLNSSISKDKKSSKFRDLFSKSTTCFVTLRRQCQIGCQPAGKDGMAGDMQNVEKDEDEVKDKDGCEVEKSRGDRGEET